MRCAVLMRSKWATAWCYFSLAPTHAAHKQTTGMFNIFLHQRSFDWLMVAVKPTACFLCVDCSDPAGYQDSARRAEMGSQSARGRGEWEHFFFCRDTVYNLFSLLEDWLHLSLRRLVWKRWENRPTASEGRCCADTSCVVWQRSRRRPAWWWV